MGLGEFAKTADAQQQLRKKRDEDSAQRRRRRRRKRQPGAGDYIEVGRGEHCVMTVNRHDGSVVVQRFETPEEAQAQHERNMAEDKPLVGVTEFN